MRMKFRAYNYLYVIYDVVGVIVHSDEGVERLEVPAVLRRHSFPRHDEVAARRRPHGGHRGVVRLNLTPWRRTRVELYSIRFNAKYILLLGFSLDWLNSHRVKIDFCLA